MTSQIVFDPNQNYDCLQCGRGCRAGWDIPVEPEVVARLQRHPLTLRVIQERGNAFRQVEDRVFIQNSKDCPNCGFLDGDQLCSIHRELGYEAKPATCKLFPFVMTQTPDGIFAGTTYYCTATRQNHGRPSSAQEGDLRQQLDSGSAPINKVAADGLVVHGRYYVSYSDYKALEQELLRRAALVGLNEALARGALGLSCLMAELPDLEEEIVAIGHRLVEMWEHPAIPGGSSVRQLGWLANLQLCDYFKFSLERPLWDAVEAGLYSGTPFELPHFQWKGTLDDLGRMAASPRFDADIERYLRHLIWRKALVVHPPLLASLLQLQMLPLFLKVHAGLLAHSRGRAVTEQDYYDALENAETYLVTHGRNRRVVNEMAVDVILGMLRG